MPSLSFQFCCLLATIASSTTMATLSFNMRGSATATATAESGASSSSQQPRQLQPQYQQHQHQHQHQHEHGREQSIDLSQFTEQNIRQLTIPRTRRLRPSKLNCTCPEDVFYRAQVTINTYTGAQCTMQEIDYVLMRISDHWDTYTAYNEILGPIDIVQAETTCYAADAFTSSTTTRGRSLETENLQHNSGWLVDNRDYSERRRDLQLFSKVKFGPYNKGVSCSYCGYDNADRRLQAAPSRTSFDLALQSQTDHRRLMKGDDALISVRVLTDDYPEEVSYEITNLAGQVVGSHSNFGLANAWKQQDWILTQDETYFLVLKDNYGDGWCCNFGNGQALVLDGETVLVNVTASFEYKSKTMFQVPVNNATKSLTNAELIARDLEPYLSTYISFYIQQQFHHNSSSCLNNTNPTIWVELEQVDEFTMNNPCGVGNNSTSTSTSNTTRT